MKKIILLKKFSGHKYGYSNKFQVIFIVITIRVHDKGEKMNIEKLTEVIMIELRNSRCLSTAPHLFSKTREIIKSHLARAELVPMDYEYQYRIK